MIRTIFAMVFLMTFYCCLPITAAELHVAPSGGADAPGTAERPLADLEQARDVIRSWKKNGKLPPGGVTAWVHGGDYFRQRSFALIADDSGTAESPIVYRSWPDETPRLLGGKRVEPSAWRTVSDRQILARLAASARSNVLQADLKPLGISRFDPLGDRLRNFAGTPELLFDGQPMQLARWPNEGWVTIERVVDRGSTGGDGETPRGGTFVYREDRPSSWSVDRGVWLHGYWCHDWSDDCLRVASVDTEKREITLAAPHGYGIGPSSSWNREPRRYYAINVLEELDVPGEWFLDRERATLYFWPPKPIKDAEVLLSTLDQPLVVLEGCENVTLRGLRLEATRGEGIVVRGGRRNLVAGCTLTNLGSTAITVHGGFENGVTSCDLSGLARSGISIHGGDRKSLTPADNFATNNHIHHFGRLQRTYAAGIHLSGVGNRVSNNLIHDAPHAAILYGGNEHVLELNEIHHVAQETSDVGAFYTGRDWTTRGNLLRWNYIHDLGQMGAVGTMGIYLDDCDSGDSLVGNVFYKAGRAAFIGGGRDNLVENNLMVECDAALHLDARGTSRIRLDAAGGDSWNLLAKAERLEYKKPPWSTRYPKLASIMDEEPLLPLGNVVRRNVAYRCKRWLISHGMDKYLDRVDFSDNLITDDDPGFVDAADQDFRLRDDSAVLRLPGWERIPIERIGLYKDEYYPMCLGQQPRPTRQTGANTQLEYRWFYSFGYGRNRRDVEKIKSLIDVGAAHGLNGMVISSFGLDSITRWNEKEIALLKEIADYCEKKQIELIPYGFTAGYGGGALGHNRSFAAALPATILLKVKAGKIVPDSGENLLVNGDLEECTNNRFKGYAFTDLPGDVSFVDTLAASGKTSIRFENFGANESGHGRIMQKVSVQTGRSYRFSFQLKTQDLKPVSGFQVLVNAKAGRSLASLHPILKPTQDWTEVTLDFISTDKEEVSLYAGIWGGKSGKYWLDDFRLHEYGTLSDIVRREGTPLALRSRDRDVLFVEGTDFETIRCLRDLKHVKLLHGSSIREAEHLELSCYKTPYVAHSWGKQVSLCMSNSQLYDYWEAQAKKLRQVIHFKRFLLSMDEIRNGGGCLSCRNRNTSMAEILGDCITRQHSIFKKIDPEIEVLIWSDMLDPAHNARDNYYGVVGDFTDSWKYVPKDLTIMCWYHKIRDQSLGFFSRQGFRTFGAAYYDADDLTNPVEWLASLKRTPNAQGIMYTTWKKKYQLLAEFGDLVSEIAAESKDEPGRQ